MAWVLIWVALSGVAGVIAAKKGRSPGGFFLLALLLSPLVGILAAIVASENKARTEEEQIHAGQARRCPFCAELVRAEAVLCKHCGRSLESRERELTTDQWDQFAAALKKRAPQK